MKFFTLIKNTSNQSFHKNDENQLGLNCLNHRISCCRCFCFFYFHSSDTLMKIHTYDNIRFSIALLIWILDTLHTNSNINIKSKIHTWYPYQPYLTIPEIIEVRRIPKVIASPRYFYQSHPYWYQDFLSNRFWSNRLSLYHGSYAGYFRINITLILLA